MRTASAGRSCLLPQRAEIVGDALRQHRHDAVGEIDRIAALQRLAVERRARPDIGGDVGDRDGDDRRRRDFLGRGRARRKTASSWSLASAGSMVTSGSVAPVLATGHGGRAGGFRLGEHAGGKDVRDVVGMDGDHRDRLLAGQRAEHRRAPCRAAGRSGRCATARPRPGRRASAPLRYSGVDRPAPAGAARPARCATCRPGRRGRRRARRPLRLSKTFMTRAV